MRDGYIDVHNEERKYRQAIARFEQDESISSRNRELVQQFLRDGALGKNNPGRARKRIGPGRQHAYLNYLLALIRFVKKELDDVKQEDMERFIHALDGNNIESRRPVVSGRFEQRPCGGPLSASYRASMKMGVRKFYKWLWGNNKTYPALVEWIETYEEWPEIPALSEADVERLLDHATGIEQRALIQCLFDGGFRIGELLNVRLEHLSRKRLDPRDPDRACFMVRITHSKTTRRTVALPMSATTKWLTLWLEKHPAQPTIRVDGTVDGRDLGMQLFPMKGNRARCILRNVGARALGKRVYPHLMRHTSATFWCNRLSYFKFCKRFGWGLTSRMPQRYIDAAGIDSVESARAYQLEELARIGEEKDRRAKDLKYAFDGENEGQDGQ